MAYPIKQGFIAITPDLPFYDYHFDNAFKNHVTNADIDKAIRSTDRMESYLEKLFKKLVQKKSWVSHIVMRNKSLSSEEYSYFIKRFYGKYEFACSDTLLGMPSHFLFSVIDSVCNGTLISDDDLPKLITHCNNEKDMRPIRFKGVFYDNLEKALRRGCSSKNYIPKDRFDGQHFTSSFLKEIFKSKRLQEKLKVHTYEGAKGIIGASCHNEEDLFMAQEIGADYCFLSPLKSSNKGHQNLSWSRFSKMASNVNMPVYALGGLDFDDLESAKKNSAAGIAGISMFT